MHSFRAELKKIGINPYISVPDPILQTVLASAGRDKGPIPVRGRVNGNPYTQTLVRYSGEWRLYINTTMLAHSPKRIGEMLEVAIGFDSKDRTLPIHPRLQAALHNDPQARQAFASLTPSHRQEINRYITNLKSAAKVDENIKRAMLYLNGKGRFVGRR